MESNMAILFSLIKFHFDPGDSPVFRSTRPALLSVCRLHAKAPEDLFRRKAHSDLPDIVMFLWDLSGWPLGETKRRWRRPLAVFRAVTKIQKRRSLKNRARSVRKTEKINYSKKAGKEVSPESRAVFVLFFSK